jgi:hypothetical protein
MMKYAGMCTIREKETNIHSRKKVTSKDHYTHFHHDFARPDLATPPTPLGLTMRTRNSGRTTRSAPTRRVANVRSTTGVLMREGAIDSPSWSMEVSFCFFRQLCLRGKPYHEVSYIPYILY